MAEEGGSERGEINGGGSMDSIESRWVFQDEDELEAEEDYEEEDEDDLRYQTMFDSEDEDNGEQRLIRTGPRIDSFDVEALEVPGAQKNDYEVISTDLFFEFLYYFPFWLLISMYVGVRSVCSAILTSFE